MIWEVLESKLIIFCRCFHQGSLCDSVSDTEPYTITTGLCLNVRSDLSQHQLTTLKEAYEQSHPESYTQG